MRYFLAALLTLALLAPRAPADLNTSASGVAQVGTWLTQFPASTGTVITSATTTAVKGTAGTLRRIVVTTGVASATIKLFNVASASCSGTPGSGALGVVTLPSTVSNPFFLDYMTTFSAGICVVTSGSTNVTVVFD